MVRKGFTGFSVRRQCDLLGLHRSSFYYRPVPVSEEELTLMNRMDEIFTQRPFYGSRRLMVELQSEGFDVGRDHVRTLMKKMGLEAIYPKKNLSVPHPDHKIYPYLLKDFQITAPNQVWSADITYIRLVHGFMYLVAILDWFSRYVLSWRLSNTLETDFCLEALEEALERGDPEIFNTDQGSQFTSERFTAPLLVREIQISMDGRGRALDNVFVERLWRSVKYEEIYLKEYRTVPELQSGLKSYFEFYNHRRPHQSLKYKTPWEVHSQTKELSTENLWILKKEKEAKRKKYYDDGYCLNI